MLLSLSSLSLLTSLPIPKHSKIPSPPAFAPIRKSFRLLSDTLEAAPKDISYVYSGYAPLSVRLVQCVAQKSAILSPAAGDNNARDDKDDAPPNANANANDDPPPPLPLPLAHPITGWKGFEDVLKLLPGEVVDRTQHSEDRADTKPAPHQGMSPPFSFVVQDNTR
jgi:vacuolar protein sorting-associated protein 33A